MGQVKLLLDDLMDYDFSLLAIHCTQEEYKIAFLLNRFLHMQLKRTRTDVDYKSKGFTATFPIFTYTDYRKYLKYSLVSNRRLAKALNKTDTNNLFAIEEKTKTLNLIPEIKQADYILKIESEIQTPPLTSLIKTINSIPHIITAYPINVEQLKSKRNLIFE